MLERNKKNVILDTILVDRGFCYLDRYLLKVKRSDY